MNVEPKEYNFKSNIFNKRGEEKFQSNKNEKEQLFQKSNDQSRKQSHEELKPEHKTNSTLNPNTIRTVEYEDYEIEEDDEEGI